MTLRRISGEVSRIISSISSTASWSRGSRRFAMKLGGRASACSAHRRCASEACWLLTEIFSRLCTRARKPWKGAQDRVWIRDLWLFLHRR